MSIRCSLFGHNLDEEKIITINRGTNIKTMDAYRHLQICNRCRCVIASDWKIRANKKNLDIM